ncbi:uncharacterized protein LOC110406665 isoform X2 [Numida meleagris]|uniref:uncharacterized protein LOC110406665 isoform X2 n=1 Tax=Numida meleagris TaxID=8996 RepID=UPI000B3E2442|nr:uncharacterized protein LOC110406665 isoform X2 [Numida meleagris]
MVVVMLLLLLLLALIWGGAPWWGRPPWGGALHLLHPGGPQHLHVLTRTYGDPLCLRLGGREVVVLSSAGAIREALARRWGDFVGRPHSYLASLVSRGGQDLALGDASPEWRRQRGATRGALARAVRHLEPLLELQGWALCQELSSYGAAPVDLFEAFAFHTCSTICRLAFGDLMPPEAEVRSFTRCVVELLEVWGRASVQALDVLPPLRGCGSCCAWWSAVTPSWRPRSGATRAVPPPQGTRCWGRCWGGTPLSLWGRWGGTACTWPSWISSSVALKRRQRLCCGLWPSCCTTPRCRTRCVRSCARCWAPRGPQSRGIWGDCRCSVPPSPRPSACVPLHPSRCPTVPGATLALQESRYLQDPSLSQTSLPHTTTPRSGTALMSSCLSGSCSQGPHGEHCCPSVVGHARVWGRHWLGQSSSCFWGTSYSDSAWNRHLTGLCPTWGSPPAPCCAVPRSTCASCPAHPIAPEPNVWDAWGSAGYSQLY